LRSNFQNILKDFSRVKVVSVSRRLLKARVSKIVGVIRRAVFSNGGGPPKREAREKEKQPAGGFSLRVVRLFCSLFSLLFSQTTDQKKGSKLTKIFSSKNLSS
jgi:hypothetical protein